MLKWTGWLNLSVTCIEICPNRCDLTFIAHQEDVAAILSLSQRSLPSSFLPLKKMFFLGHHKTSTAHDDSFRSLTMYWWAWQLESSPRHQPHFTSCWFLVAPWVLSSIHMLSHFPHIPGFLSWFFSSYHTHWSTDRRISQTALVISNRADSLYQLSVYLPPCLYQQSLWWTASRSVRSIPLPHPFGLFLSHDVILCSLLFCVCVFSLHVSLCGFPRPGDEDQ